MKLDKPLCYLASPFSSYKKTKLDREVELDNRFRQVSKLGGRLVAQGLHILGPISQSHPMAIYGGIKHSNWDYWKELDTNMLRRCDIMLIADMAGWKESKGVRGEVIIAGTLEIPVFLVDTRSLEWIEIGLKELRVLVGPLTKEDKKDIKKLLRYK